MRNAALFLGVDGGGTKTAAAALDAKGRILALVEGPPSLRTQTTWTAATRAIAETVGKLERRMGRRALRFEAACFALAGVDSPADVRTAKRLLRKRFGVRVGRLCVVNDVVAALRAGTDASSAAAVIAGTGSHAFAKGARGEAYAGGFGWILGDDGGGFWIGRAALRAVVRSLDGQGPKTSLSSSVLRHFRVRSMGELHEHLTGLPLPKRSVSQLSVLVDRSGRRGDRVSIAILTKAGERLARMVHASARRAGLGRIPFPLVISGGCFRSSVLEHTFRRAVRRVLPRVRIIRTTAVPAVGAARLAREGVR